MNEGIKPEVKAAEPTATSALDEFGATIKKLEAKAEADEISAVTWVKAHWVVIALFGGIILGCIAGHFIR